MSYFLCTHYGFILDYSSSVSLPLLHLEPGSLAFALSHLLSAKLLEGKPAIMSEGFADYMFNEMNAIASVNFQNNRTAQRCHTNQERLASADGSVTPP